MNLDSLIWHRFCYSKIHAKFFFKKMKIKLKVFAVFDDILYRARKMV